MNERKTELQAAEVQLKYKSRIPKSKRKQITCSQDAFRVLWDSWDKDTIEHREIFKVMLLNGKNMVLGIAELFRGGITSTVIDPRLVMQAAIKTNAVGIIITHNHPSGNTVPSESDVEITKKLMEAGKMLNITVLDHIILGGDGSYFSLADEGRL